MLAALIIINLVYRYNYTSYYALAKYTYYWVDLLTYTFIN